MQLKTGVSLRGLTTQACWAMCVVSECYREMSDLDGTPLILTITSAFRPGPENLLHGRDEKCDAFDARTHNVPRAKLPMLVATVRARLGDEFDVILEAEGTPNEHMHVEYDPEWRKNARPA